MQDGLNPGVEAWLGASDPEVLVRTDEIMSRDGVPPRVWNPGVRGVRKAASKRAF